MNAQPHQHLKRGRRHFCRGLISIGLLALSISLPLGVRADFSALVVAGLGGNTDYQERFDEDAQLVADALRTLTIEKDNVVLLTGEQVSLAAIQDAFERISGVAGDQFVLILIGHGTSDGRTYRFNIPGPDLTTQELVAGLTMVNSSQQAVVVATSASGELLDILSQPSRVVLTATKSAGEINAVKYSEYLAEALSSNSADIDRNEILTMAEAFRYATEQTAKFYESRKLFASEHARISGDTAKDIPLAYLGGLAKALQNPEVAQLLDQRLELELEFHALKATKGDLIRSDYYGQLEELLVKIALLQQKIDRATGWETTDG